MRCVGNKRQVVRTHKPLGVHLYGENTTGIHNLKFIFGKLEGYSCFKDSLVFCVLLPITTFYNLTHDSFLFIYLKLKYGYM